MPTPPPNERPTAAQLAAQCGNDPWVCPRCGCRDWRVLDTRDVSNGNLARTRICRHCGKDGPRIYTEEKPYRVISPDDEKLKDCA
jgi:hypothetical protein